MANGTEPQRNYVRFIVSAILILGICCIGCGTILIFKGFGGDLLIGGGLSAISSLAGFLGAGRPHSPAPDINVSTTPPTVAVTQLETTS